MPHTQLVGGMGPTVPAPPTTMRGSTPAFLGTGTYLIHGHIFQICGHYSQLTDRHLKAVASSMLISSIRAC